MCQSLLYELKQLYQIEIEVVLQLRGIENFERDFGDLSRSFPRTPMSHCCNET